MHPADLYLRGLRVSACICAAMSASSAFTGSRASSAFTGSRTATLAMAASLQASIASGVSVSGGGNSEQRVWMNW
jgi:hypothetical protein